MRRIVLLHTNDIHGSVDGLARVATLVERIRASDPSAFVLYLDAGDVEATGGWLSSVTKGTAMHRLLGRAGCQAAAAGNHGWMHYGTQILREHAAVASYPLLLANLRSTAGGLLPGVQDAKLIGPEGARVGLIGITAVVRRFEPELFGVRRIPEPGLVRCLARELRASGADVVVLLSHLGLDVPAEEIDDRRLALELQGEVDVIIGAHSHDLLEAGEWFGEVLVTQAGTDARHLGRVDIDDGRATATVIPVTLDTPLHPGVMEEAETATSEVAAFLDEPIAELPTALDVNTAAGWLAAILRDRMHADVAVVTPGQAFSDGLPAGVIRRRDLWSVCDSSANPGVVAMTGEQLQAVVTKGTDTEFARTTAALLDGRPRGLLQRSSRGAVIPEGTYTVAGTDWELEAVGGMVNESWNLKPRYDFPTIVREVIEEHLAIARRQ